MESKAYRFRFRTGEIVIDHQRCLECNNYACIKADALFGTGVLRIEQKMPVLTTSSDDVKRLCNECLACELYCQSHGNRGLTIRLDTFGLEEYQREAVKEN